MMDILDTAIASGMHVTLDGRIGTQEYRSVHGSVQALQRFAEAVLTAGPNVAGRQKSIDAECRTDSLKAQRSGART
jgi:hypothetical protein